jgi:peptidyl-prolyl cis-trans isomerase A (cyclophilin A)
MKSSRRRYVAGLAGCALASITGCLFEEPSSDTSTATATATDVFTSTPRTVASENEPMSAVLRTSRGRIECRLYHKKAPRTVQNFVGLATGSIPWRDPETDQIRTTPLYNDLLFHRVIAGFMIQTGDPSGTGLGGPGYTFDDELDSTLRHDKPGVLSMANSGPDTNGSQFFITVSPQPHLDGQHTVFGQVVDGIETVYEISRVPTDKNNRPATPVELNTVIINS